MVDLILEGKVVIIRWNPSNVNTKDGHGHFDKLSDQVPAESKNAKKVSQRDSARPFCGENEIRTRDTVTRMQV